MSDFYNRLRELTEIARKLSIESQCDSSMDWHVVDWLASAGSMIGLAAYRQEKIEKGKIHKSSIPVDGAA